MTLTPGPRELLPIERLRRSIYGLLASDDDSGDGQITDKLPGAVSRIEQELGAPGADILDRTRRFTFAAPETPTLGVRLQCRWLRSVDSAAAETAGTLAPPTQGARLGPHTVVMPPAGGWPAAPDQITLTCSTGIGPDDPELGAIQLAIEMALAHAIMEMSDEKPRTNQLDRTLAPLKLRAAPSALGLVAPSA